MRLEEGDCLKLFKSIEDESIDAVITDPPYNIGKDFEGENLQIKEWTDWCEKWVKECNRVLIAGGAFYITLGWQSVAEFKVMVNKFPELRLKNWIIWYRQDGWKGDKGYGQSYENILYYIKDGTPAFDLTEFGKHITEKRLEAGYKTVDALMEAMGLYTLVHRKTGKDGYFSGAGFVESGKKRPTLQELIRLNELLKLDEKYHVNAKTIKQTNVLFNKTDVSDDVWLNPKSEKDRLGHPTQKPIKLMRRMVLTSSNEGDVVLDPFMGSGTTGVACKETGREFIGFELDKRYFEIAKRRINEAIRQKQINEGGCYDETDGVFCNLLGTRRGAGFCQLQ